MPACEALDINGNKCGRGSDKMPYFWFNDSEDAFDKKFRICQDHSQEFFKPLLESEYQMKAQIEYLKKQIKKLKNETRQARSSKNAEMEYDIKTKYEQSSRLYDKLNALRNRTCRLCGYPLKEPQDPTYQTTDRYSHIDLHSPKGYRREILLFHTKCGRIWILQKMNVDLKLKQGLMPSMTGQYTLTESLSSTKKIVI